jgi:hypothetical protein
VLRAGQYGAPLTGAETISHLAAPRGNGTEPAVPCLRLDPHRHLRVVQAPPGAAVSGSPGGAFPLHPLRESRQALLECLDITVLWNSAMFGQVLPGATWRSRLVQLVAGGQ